MVEKTKGKVKYSQLFLRTLGIYFKKVSVKKMKCKRNLFAYYSSGLNNSVVLNKQGGLTIFPKSINVWLCGLTAVM